MFNTTIPLRKIPFRFKILNEALYTTKMEFGSQMEKRLSECCNGLFGDHWEYQIKYYKNARPLITGLILQSKEDLFLFNLTWN